jgi:alkylhydroperoxidase/carboxymuconolactone decarboxylase family protein YurZ
MSITPAAQANHDELFPGHRSTLAETDPEFTVAFDNFAFDEVIGYGNLGIQTRLKVILAALIAMQTLSEYRVMLGLARAFDFLHATNEILTGLDIGTRELLTFAMLTAMGGCEPQLRGHIKGNTAVGNDKTTLLSVVTQLLPYIGYPRALNAIACLNEVLP